MLNKVMLIGRLGADPDIKYGANGGAPFGRLSVATDESYTDRDGNKVDRTEWHSVLVFQRLAENCQSFLTKGSLVYVEGSLTTRKWEDKEGQTRYTTEIRAQRVIFLDRKQNRQEGWNEAGESVGMNETAFNKSRRQQAGDWSGNASGKPKNNAQKQQNRAPSSDQDAASGINRYNGAGSEAEMDDMPF